MTRHSNYFLRLLEGVKQDDSDDEVDKEAEDDNDNYLDSLKGNESDLIRLDGSYCNEGRICKNHTGL